MKKLTETLIQQRLKTCTTDLEKVQQINVTGRELQDVSLLRKMTGVEILSLSVNQISSLADFEYCKNLKELYLRNNKISDLNEICYLKNLSKLQLLMLSQNPCANDPLYRMTVIKHLKNLIELDGVPVTSEERRQAVKLGKEIYLVDEPLTHTENYIPDGPQIQRTPTQSTQKLELSHENLSGQIESMSYCETINENDTEGNLVTEDVEQSSLKLPLSSEKTCKKTSKRFPRTDIKPKPSMYADASMCKFCKNEMMKPLRVTTNNYNILSATLNLVKELDYSGLQIINAEVGSRLNAFEIDLIYNAKP